MRPKSTFRIHPDDVPAEVNKQIKLLIDVVKSPGVVALRLDVTQDSGQLNDSTVGRMNKDLLRFLGFLFNVLRWPKEQLGLKSFANMFIGKNSPVRKSP